MNSNFSTNGGERNGSVSRSRRSAIWVAKAGILAAVAAVLMYFEFPLPLMPVFLKYDFSDMPVLLATFALGPLTGIIVQFIKNLIHLPVSATGLIGELANFVMGSAFVGVAGLVYKFRKTRLGAVQALVAGTLALTLAGCLMNYYVMIPFYISAMGLSMEAIAGMVAAAGNNLVTDLWSLILYVFVPFNIFKGLSISFLTMLIYKKVSPLLHK
jgi:riboflavin transporter FmnP